MTRIINLALLYEKYKNSPTPVLDLKRVCIPSYCPPELLTKFEEDKAKRIKETSEPKVPSL